MNTAEQRIEMREKLVEYIKRDYPSINLNLLSKEAGKIITKLPSITCDSFSMFALCGMLDMVIIKPEGK